jgi:tetratricopeptide (TPR) repeat protein
MQNPRQQAYFNLIDLLLNGPCIQEQEILDAHQELLDEGLVTAALTRAQLLAEQKGEAARCTVQGLVNFGVNLAKTLGMTLPQELLAEVTKEIGSQEDFDFFQELIQAGDSTLIQQLFAQNIQRLSPGLAAVMKGFVKHTLNNWPEDAEEIADAIENIVVELFDFQLGDRAQNLELVISGYDAALKIRTQDAFPLKWADLQNNRASMYMRRINGNRIHNLELAINGYDNALQVFKQTSDPIEWAIAQSNRATAYMERTKGNRAQNLEQAISGYDAVLQVRTRDAFPIDWARTHNNRANAYIRRSKGDPVHNLEMAVQGYNNALQVFSQSLDPIGWSGILNNRDAAVSKLIDAETAKRPKPDPLNGL